MRLDRAEVVHVQRSEGGPLAKATGRRGEAGVDRERQGRP